MLPARKPKARMGLRDTGPVVCQGHRRWVRSHQCCVPGCQGGPTEAHHVRIGTGGGTARKPDDAWLVALCSDHHDEGHQIGWTTFEAKYRVNLRMLALEFAAASPAWQALLRKQRENA